MANIQEAIEDTLMVDDVNDTTNVALIQKVSLNVEESPVKNLLIKHGDGYRLPSAIIEIRPIDKAKWHGKTGNDDFDKGSSVEACVYKSQYLTGLHDEERKYLESLTGFDLSSKFSLNDVHPFYGTLVGKMTLPNKTVLLDLSAPLDFIKYKLCTQHPLVALNLDQVTANVKPSATHYIHDETVVEAKELATGNLIEEVDDKFAALNANERKFIYTVYSETDPKLIGDDIIKAKLLNLKRESPAKLHTLLNQPKITLQVTAQVIIGIARNVIEINAGRYLYKDAVLGYDISQAVEFLTNPENQMVRTSLIQHIKEK